MNQENANIYFIADAHLGADTSEHELRKERHVASFLQNFPREHARLIICGDLFDFWFEYRHVVPRRHFQILAHLAQLTRAGVAIDYIAGNHDFWLGSFLQKEIGMTVHRDDMILAHGRQRIYIRHGDGLMKKDYLYRLLKKILRFRPNIFLYRLLHPDLGIPVALFFSHLSRNAARNKKEYSDADYRAYARDRLSRGFDGVVLGHSHVAALDRYPEGWYLNPGDWMRLFTYGLLQDGQPALYRWDGVRGHLFDPESATRKGDFE